MALLLPEPSTYSLMTSEACAPDASTPPRAAASRVGFIVMVTVLVAAIIGVFATTLWPGYVTKRREFREGWLAGLCHSRELARTVYEQFGITVRKYRPDNRRKDHA